MPPAMGQCWSERSIAPARFPPLLTEPDEQREPVASGRLRQRVRRFTYRTLLWGRDRVPAGVRSLIGALFCLGGVFGFLPVLGFWMLPLGLGFIALDVPALRPRLDRRIEQLKHSIDYYESHANQ